MLDFKRAFRGTMEQGPSGDTRGRVSVYRLEPPAQREFPALSDYNIITLQRFGAHYNLRKVALVGLAFLPTIVATIYFALIVTPRYEAEAKFVVRTAAKASGVTGVNSILSMTGLARSQDDVFSVQDFITSRDALEQLMERLPLEEIYARPNADFVARYPSIFFGTSREQFFKYFQWMISVSYSGNTGISTLRVQAFRPEDARAVAEALLDRSEQLVNRMNQRIHEDAVRISASQVESDEQRMVAAQIALTDFRNRELMIDPEKSSVVLSEVIKRLSSNLAETQAQVHETRAASPSSPQLATLQNRVAAIDSQIAQERARITNSSDGLAGKIGEFERLNLEREYAKEALTKSTASLEAARTEARRKQLYLERVVEPHLPDYASMPSTVRWIATTLGANLLIALVGWLFITGIREHAATT